MALKRNLEAATEREGTYKALGDTLLRALLFLIPLILLSPHCLFAVGNLHFGSFFIHPFLGVNEGYVENVSLNRRGHEKSSGYRSFTPGIKCNWQKTKFNFTMDYLHGFVRYDQKFVQDRDYYTFDSQYEIPFGRSGYSFTQDGAYSYRRTTEPATSEETAEEHKESDLRLGLKARVMERFGIGVTPYLKKSRYEDYVFARQRNKDTVGLTIKGSIRPFSKTGILLEYGYRKLEYNDPVNSDSKDSKVNSILTGLEWEATARLTGAVKAGYQWKKYSERDTNSPENSSPETWDIKVDLKQEFSEFTSMSLMVAREINDSTYTYKKQEAGYYYANKIKLGLKHKLTYKVSTWMDVSYDYADYGDIPRRDTIWWLYAGFRYQFLEWISANISYNTSIKHTNMDDADAYDYQSSTTNIGLNMTF